MLYGEKLVGLGDRGHISYSYCITFMRFKDIMSIVNQTKYFSCEKYIQRP